MLSRNHEASDSGNRVTIKIINKDQIFEATATVLYSRPMMGMAVAFREVKPIVKMRWGKIVEIDPNEDSQAVAEALKMRAAHGIEEASAPPIVS